MANSGMKIQHCEGLDIPSRALQLRDSAGISPASLLTPVVPVTRLRANVIRMHLFRQILKIIAHSWIAVPEKLSFVEAEISVAKLPYLQTMTEKPKLNLFDFTMIVVSLVIGMGIFRAPANVAKESPDSFLFFCTWIIGGLDSALRCTDLC
jgi:hypothetical protein